MAAAKYVVAPGELLIITVCWTGGINKGSANTLETEIRCYNATDIQAMIDENTCRQCHVTGVDRYDPIRRIGEDISDQFDLRPHQERQGDDEDQRLDAAIFGTDEMVALRRQAARHDILCTTQKDAPEGQARHV
jgi:hypothetical protein